MGRRRCIVQSKVTFRTKLSSKFEVVCDINKTAYEWVVCDRIFINIVFATPTGMFHIKFSLCGKNETEINPICNPKFNATPLKNFINSKYFWEKNETKVSLISQRGMFASSPSSSHHVLDHLASTDFLPHLMWFPWIFYPSILCYYPWMYYTVSFIIFYAIIRGCIMLFPFILLH
jgi:hypothetical protein